MFEFKTYNGTETLQDDGFQVFNSEGELRKLILGKSTQRDLELISRNSYHRDIFRTKLGDIKQIQNLDFGLLNHLLVNLIGGGNFKLLNNQYFCKPPNYKMTSAHQDNAYFESTRKVFTFLDSITRS